MKNHTLYIISGPSGVGKTTLVQALFDEQARLSKDQTMYQFPKRVITYTTRAPRQVEQDGVDYYFISQSDFIQKVNQGFFAEYSTAYSAWYGMAQSVFEDIKAGRCSYIAILDRTGAQTLKQKYKDLVMVVWLTVDFATLGRRLLNRGTDALEVVEQRLQLAQQELQAEEQEPLADICIDTKVFENAKTALLSLFLTDRVDKLKLF